MLLLIIFHFLIGAGASCLFSFFWESHWIGRMILITICVTAVGFALFDISGFIASLNVWYIELSQFFGIVVGSIASKRIIYSKRI